MPSALYLLDTGQFDRWALTHPVSVKEYEKLKKKQMKPDFLDMVPWYSGYILLYFCIISSIYCAISF